MDKKMMSREVAQGIIWACGRAEWSENPRCYKKGIRSLLIALGYDEDWVNGEFRQLLDDFGGEYYEGEASKCEWI